MFGKLAPGCLFLGSCCLSSTLSHSSPMPVSQAKSSAMDILASFGFALGRASVHTARTMMLRELTLLLDIKFYSDARDALFKALNS